MGPLLVDQPPPKFKEAELVANEWTKYFIAEPYRPHEAVRYIALPRTGDRICDLVRSRYVANGLLVTITQSLGMFCVQVKSDLGHLKTETLEDVQQTARSLFNKGSMLQLAESGSVLEPGTANAVASPELPWAKTLSWKRTDGGIAFWMFKDDGHPRMASLGVTVSANAYWYSVPAKGP
ncbi:MAG: hypothetical protein ACREHD_32535 [Pirellulales bacterium]